MDTSYVVSARKYRPATFRSVVGQTALTNTLIGAIGSGRLAHAYLFCGPRGVGKTSCARIFAKTINCLNPTADGEACGECESCRAIDSGTSFNIVELDAASNNGVDHMRQLTEQVMVPPQVGKYRVFIIDEVHMLTSAAFNAFLKTLEEPPSYVIFILATTEKQKVLPTVLSRCQIYDFRRITIADIAEHLQYVAEKEGVKADPMALNVIAQKADGAMRDALSIFDQVAAASGGNITYAAALENLNVLDYDYYFRLIDAFMAGDVQEALLIYKEIRDKGFDSLFFVNGLANHVRNVMVAADARTVALLEVGKEIADRYIEQARKVPVAWHYQALQLLNDCDLNYRTATDKQLLVELTLIRLATIQGAPKAPKAPAPLPELPKTTPQPAATPQPASQPASQTTPQPASQPTAQAAPQPPVQAAQRVATPRAKTSASMRTPSISAAMNDDDDDADHHAAPEQAQQPEGRSEATLPQQQGAYSDDDVVAAWDAFAAEKVELRLLVASMRAAKPTRREGDTFEVTVVSPNEKVQFDENMIQLLEYIRRRLGNDNFKLAVNVAESIEGMSVYVPPHEFVRKAMENNPVIDRLFEEIDAVIE